MTKGDFFDDIEYYTDLVGRSRKQGENLTQ